MRFASFALLLAVGCSSSPQARIRVVKQGHFECFRKGTAFSCEPSGVAFHGRYLIVANDKPIAGAERSSIFRFPVRDGVLLKDEREYLPAINVVDARKWEDLALTPDGKTLLAVTGFSKLDPDSPAFDDYNVLLSWRLDSTSKPRVVLPSSRGGRTSSRLLRSRIVAALGMGSFQVEGLACLPDNRLLIGIRTMGEKRSSEKKLVAILSVSFQTQGEKMLLRDDMKLVYKYDFHAAGRLAGPVGLSGLTFDKSRNRLYILLSYERGKKLGGYLAFLSTQEFDSGQPPHLVYDQSGKVLNFGHKPEAITVLDKSRLIVIHDDDRVLLGGRQLHQGPYTILQWVK